MARLGKRPWARAVVELTIKRKREMDSPMNLRNIAAAEIIMLRVGWIAKKVEAPSDCTFGRFFGVT